MSFSKINKRIVLNKCMDLLPLFGSLDYSSIQLLPINSTTEVILKLQELVKLMSRKLALNKSDRLRKKVEKNYQPLSNTLVKAKMFIFVVRN